MRHDPAPSLTDVESAAQQFWWRATRRLSRQINLGWWLSSWLPLAAAIGLVGMVAILYVRWRLGEASAWVWGGMVASLLLAGLVAWWRSRSRFESDAAARVRLEETFGLHARLTAAYAGVGGWPEPPSPTEKSWPVTWQWQRPVASVALIAAMLGLAAWVPIASAVALRTHTIEKPTDARMVEQWLEELEAAEFLDERTAEEVDRRIKELTERPAEQWYEHASLEAASTLKEQTAAAMRELADNLSTAERAAAALHAMQDSLPQPLREALAKELAAAIRGLELGQIQPAGDLAKLLEELRSAELGALELGELSPEQLEALAKRLAANRVALNQALSQCQGFKLSECEGCCQGDGCKMCGGTGCQLGSGQTPGQGSISRGRGDAELSFGQDSDLGTTRLEMLGAEIDAERAVPDAVLAVLDGEHDVDESVYTGPKAGGAITNDGDGGAAVQVDMFLPADQAAVKRFFK
jgi:hypothetical protein